MTRTFREMFEGKFGRSGNFSDFNVYEVAGFVFGFLRDYGDCVLVPKEDVTGYLIDGCEVPIPKPEQPKPIAMDEQLERSWSPAAEFDYHDRLILKAAAEQTEKALKAERERLRKALRSAAGTYESEGYPGKRGFLAMLLELEQEES